MNREMLFTDKRKDDNEWVEGDSTHRQIWRPKIAIIRASDDGFDHYEEDEVASETVGQFTGLMDKNGKKILDGDILQVGVVGISDGNCKYVEGWDSTRWEVIGHVYDNKELLGND